MERSTDPAHVRVGMCIGSAEDCAASAKFLKTVHQVLGRVLNLVRLAVVALPLGVQCLYVHSVDFGSWLCRLALIYALIGGTCFFAFPEQLYHGMGLGSLRWLFEMYHPEIAFPVGASSPGGGSGSDGETATVPAASTAAASRGCGLRHGARVKLRWHDSDRFLCITREGWAVTGEQRLASTLLVRRAFAKDKQLPDTYTFQLDGPEDSDWHRTSLSFKPVNHLRFGGWLGAFRDPDKACPYKVLQDSSCPSGAFKLLCAWTGIPPPTQRHVTGFYLAEQRYGGRLYIGHAPDRDAALLEAVTVS